MRRFWVLVLILAIAILAVASTAEARRARTVSRMEVPGEPFLCVTLTPGRVDDCGRYLVIEGCWDVDGNLVSYTETWYGDPCRSIPPQPPKEDR